MSSIVQLHGDRTLPAAGHDRDHHYTGYCYQQFHGNQPTVNRCRDRSIRLAGCWVCPG